MGSAATQGWNKPNPAVLRNINALDDRTIANIANTEIVIKISEQIYT